MIIFQTYNKIASDFFYLFVVLSLFWSYNTNVIFPVEILDVILCLYISKYLY